MQPDHAVTASNVNSPERGTNAPSMEPLIPKGVEVSDEEIQAINLTHGKFHGEWNYTIAPNQQPP